MIYFYIGLLIATTIFCVVEYKHHCYVSSMFYGAISVLNVFTVLGELMNIT